MQYLDSGWLFQSGQMRNIIKDVSEEDLFDLFRLAEEDDAWSERVHEEIEQGKRFSDDPAINACHQGTFLNTVYPLFE